jgi:putative peptidoglycan binding protein
MKRSLLIYIGSLTFALTAGAQMPNNAPQRRAPQRATASFRHGGVGNVRQMGPQRTFSATRFHQQAVSNARFSEPMFRTTRMQPRMNTSFLDRSAMNNVTARRPMRPFANDWTGSRFSAQPRVTNSFVNRSATRNIAARRQTHLAVNNLAGSSFGEQTRTSSSFVNRSLGATTGVRGQTRAVFSNNWRGPAFAGRQYAAFRNYQSQWHDSDWYWHNCDRIVFVTVFSQPFPFFFDAGYWYPAWGYYPDAYYPYDGPIYGYNDLPPDEVIGNVQTELYNEGYYNGPIDGVLGPDTRAAIADYQRDHGLAVTAAIDEPTVASLGLA